MLGRYNLGYKHKLLIFSRLSDLMTCSERFDKVRGLYLSSGTL